MLKALFVLTYLTFLTIRCHRYTFIISFHHTLNPTGNVTLTSTLSLGLPIWPSNRPSPVEISRQNNLHRQILPFLSNTIVSTEPQYRPILNSSLHIINISPKFQFWNPAIISLPSFSPHQYLIISRILTDGSYHKNIACLADWSYRGNGTSAEASIKALVCDPSTIKILDVPPTVSKNCKSRNGMPHFEKFPGFHDARVSWMRNGDVLVVAGSGSLNTCFGMHVFSLLPYYRPLSNLLGSATPFGLGPHIAFLHITELERPPPYAFFEKNWIPFHSSSGLYFQSDHSPGKRTVAKHYGFGKVSSNLTTYNEPNCFPAGSSNGGGKGDPKWHLGTGVLEMMLCKRGGDCLGKGSVFIGIVHRKITNKLGLMELSGKYEKYVVVYDGKAPFRTLAFSRRAVLYGGERDDGFVDMLGGEVVQKTEKGDKEKEKDGVKFSKTFTYTLSLSWDNHDKEKRAGRMGVGYLDDDVVAGVGVGDNGVLVARFGIKDLLKDLREC